MNRPEPLRGSNGVAFGPDGRLYVAEFIAGRISAVDLASGDVERVVAPDGPVQAPDDLAFAADGSMYITDLTPGRVWRRDPSGSFTLVSDGLAAPNGIACAGERLFVNEMCPGGRFLELTADGGHTVLADGVMLGNAMQLGPDGMLYYPHMLTGEIHRVSPDGGDPEVVATGVDAPVAARFDRAGTLTVLSRGPEGIDPDGDGRHRTTPGELSGMDNAAFDAENRMYVSRFAAGGIAEVTADGRAREVVAPGLAGPYGVAVHFSGTVFAADNYRLAAVADGRAHTRELLLLTHGVAAGSRGLHLTSQFGTVRTYDPDGRRVLTRAEGLSRPTGIAELPQGGLVVAETGAGRVVTLDSADAVTGVSEGSDLAVLADGLDEPVDVAVDVRGRCYVTEQHAGTIGLITGAGVEIVTGGLDAPHGITAADGLLFVVETGRRRVLSVDPDTGERAIVAAELPLAAPAGRARAQPALFNHGLPGVAVPFAGIDVGADGALYVAAAAEGTVLRLTMPSTGE
ncbi:sugar lactone lactonase YvrE [Prauserella isguenensis]|uniref:Sugar lactone lactonase YvrE n=1 Tax=Prauserella isguenensis TaxID=1470180 RepID=A0A839S0K5_9PSEU|nr:hypothetical protein [Prauserella isguenensis]MBB3051601.1 sugar lactone lactonase YvrE [Prauserella isguenensis]